MSFFFSSRRRHTRYWRDWSSDVCSSDLLPRLAAAVGRPVQQAEGRGDRLVAAARRGVGEERAVAVAQEAGEVAHLPADRLRHVAYGVPGLGVAHELDEGGHLVPPAGGEDGERDAAGD